MVLDRIAEFLRRLLERHDVIHKQNEALKEGQDHMSATLQTIIAKLNDQGAALVAQGKQIDSLIAERDAKEQADLDQIDALLDANASAANANAAKMAAAIVPVSSDDAGAAKPSTSATTTVDTTAGVTTATDAAAGTVTTVDHSTGEATTVDTSTGAPVATDPAVLAAAAAATAAAGVVLPPA